MQLDDPCLSLIQRSQTRHRIVELDHQLVVSAVGNALGIECFRHASRPALQAVSTTGVLHENLPHGATGNGQEMSSIVIRDVRAGKLRVGFMHQLGGAERVARNFVAQLEARERPELIVDESEEVVEGCRIARAPRRQKARDLRLHGAPSIPQWAPRDSWLPRPVAVPHNRRPASSPATSVNMPVPAIAAPAGHH